ncbi:hypothetical protein [Luteimonas abyssi]|uniref:hypothetical protein n=1 Tax=Luteimonas abyssi TaxID=1247514 RepID=UPI000737D40E|nr:hypothetical protein [Luteimonas abyssi]
MLSSSSGLPKLPFTKDEWRKKTSRALAPRGGTLEALDILIDAYSKHPSRSNLLLLQRGFNNWCQAQGPGDAWKSKRRNDKASLPFIALEAALNGKGDSDAALGVPSFMTEDLISSRKGLLYLFGYLECEGNKFNIVTNGVIDLGNTAMGFAGGQVGGTADEVTGYVGTGIGVAGQPLAGKAADALDRRHSRNAGRMNLSGGELHAQGPKTGSIDYLPSVDMEKRRTVSSELLLKAQPSRLSPKEKEVSNALYDRLEKTWKVVVDYWDDGAGGHLRILCDYLTKSFLSDAVTGALGGAFSITSNLINLIESSFHRYQAWALNRSVKVWNGVPTSIVDGIKRSMDLTLGNDLYQTLKSGAQLGMQIGSVGASTIVNFVTAIVEILIKTAYRLYETKMLQTFLADAKDKWRRRDNEKLYLNPMAFNAWFRPHAMKVPIIPALALNSNIVHNMSFLQLFPDKNGKVNQSQYDLGMTKMGMLKAWCSRYIEESGYQLSSADGLVEAWTKPGVRQGDSGFRKHALGPAMEFLGG